MSGLYLLSTELWGADRKSASIVAIFCTVIMACILMAEGENDEKGL